MLEIDFKYKNAIKIDFFWIEDFPESPNQDLELFPLKSVYSPRLRRSDKPTKYVCVFRRKPSNLFATKHFLLFRHLS